MHFLATYWWLFMIAAAVFYALAFANQIKRMRGMMVGVAAMNVENAFGSFSKGIGLMLAWGLLGSVNGVLFVVGVIAALMGK